MDGITLSVTLQTKFNMSDVRLRELKDRRVNLRQELVEIDRAIARLEGYTILLRDDPTYTPLHTDLDTEVVAEGSVTIGPPHLYYFYYDYVYQEHTPSITIESPPAAPTVDVDVMSDSESSEEHPSSIPTPSQLKRERVGITSEKLKYQTALPDGLKKGSIHSFFVIRPDSETVQ
jgi:hypothetical protein